MTPSAARMRARGSWRLRKSPANGPARWRAGKCSTRRISPLDGDMRAPSATFEYMLYQALLGAWQPDDDTFPERMQAYALKAAREGKQETSWLNPHQAYEAGLETFIATDSGSHVSAEFLNSVETLAQRAVAAGRTELAEPDHAEGHDAGRAGLLSGHGVLGSFAGRSRQPAAGRFCRARRACWRRWSSRTGGRLAQNWRNGHLKLAWTRHLLKLRTELAEVFTDGDYQPLEVSGPHRDHVIAFARRRGRDAAIVAVARSFAPSRKADGRGLRRATPSMARSNQGIFGPKALPARCLGGSSSPLCFGICRRGDRKRNLDGAGSRRESAHVPDIIRFETQRPPGIDGRTAWRLSCRQRRSVPSSRAGLHGPENSLPAS